MAADYALSLLLRSKHGSPGPAPEHAWPPRHAEVSQASPGDLMSPTCLPHSSLRTEFCNRWPGLRVPQAGRPSTMAALSAGGVPRAAAGPAGHGAVLPHHRPQPGLSGQPSPAGRIPHPLQVLSWGQACLVLCRCCSLGGECWMRLRPNWAGWASRVFKQLGSMDQLAAAQAHIA